MEQIKACTLAALVAGAALWLGEHALGHSPMPELSAWPLLALCCHMYVCAMIGVVDGALSVTWPGRPFAFAMSLALLLCVLDAWLFGLTGRVQVVLHALLFGIPLGILGAMPAGTRSARFDRGGSS